MRFLFTRALMAAGVCALAFPAAASAQPGADVLVNPGASTGGQLLLYPGGGYARMVPNLLMPGQKSGPIHLHMPTHRRTVRVARAPEAAPADTTPAPAEPAPAPKPRRRVQVASAAPPPPSRPTPAPKPIPAPSKPQAYANGYPDTGAAGLMSGQSLTFTPTTPPPSSGQVARANPPPDSSLPGLTKQSVIIFAKGSAEPADTALTAIKFLAGKLNAAMVSPASRVELQAYGGDRGDKSSDARRLSLKRALAIRQTLIDDGVSSDRIDVHAMGGVDDAGPADRVDVLVKS